MLECERLNWKRLDCSD